MSTAPCVYQETRLNLDPANSRSSFEIQIPSNDSFASRLSPKRRRIDQAPADYDEDTFSRLHLASESSIHFRPKPKYGMKEQTPRAILWRLLDGERLLELQAVDLYQDKEERNEPLSTLRFSFPDPVYRAGVTFAEKEHEAGINDLAVMVLTRSGELYSLALKNEYFLKPALLQDGSIRGTDWCTRYTASSLNYRRPFKILAKNSQELWVSCGDGALVKMEMKDDANWRETAYSEGGWKGSVRGLISWKASKTVRHDDAELQASTATSLAFSPNGMHVFAVGLDHAIRVLSLEKGLIVARQDLAGDIERDFQKPAESLLQPSHSQRLQIIPGKNENEYFAATFSPRTREFKLWLVISDETGDLQLSPARRDVQLLPPPDIEESSVWNMESFHFENLRSNGHGEWKVWMLVRFGTHCKTYTTSFSATGPVDAIERSWHNGWALADIGLLSAKRLDEIAQNPSSIEPGAPTFDGLSSAERWLSYLLYPGRYTTFTLETALSIYKRSLGPSATNVNKRVTTQSGTPLKVRIGETIGSSVYLGAVDQDAAAFGRYERAIAQQWQIFYGVIKDLHARREEILSLAVDPDEHLPWLIGTDTISVVRACGEAELLWHNRGAVLDLKNIKADDPFLQALGSAEKLQLGQLFHALDTFRRCLSSSFVQSFAATIDAKILQGGSDERSQIQSIYDETGFADQVSDDDYDRITDALEPLGGLANLDNQTLLWTLELFVNAERGRHHNKDAKKLTRYGARTLTAGSQEMLELCSTVILDTLLLLVFIGGGLEAGDLSEDFDAAQAFDDLAKRLKPIRLLQWLASTFSSKASCHTMSKKQQPGGILNHETAQIETLNFSNATLLEDYYVQHWSGLKFPSEPQQSLITYWIQAWIFRMDLDENYDPEVLDILGSLIMNRDLGLADDFLPFVPETPWALYLTGRLHLSRGEAETASTCFGAAADGLAKGANNVDRLPAIDMLDVDERECINRGHARYYLHVNNLFERAKDFGYAADFANEGLEAHGDDPRDDDKLRTELLSHLSTSALKTSQFSLAFETLASHTELTLRDASLRAYITSLLTTPDGIPTLISTPYSAHNLSILADSILTDLFAQSTQSTQLNTKPHLQANIPFHKILYAFRLQQNDLRGAAACLWERLQHLRQRQDVGFRGEDVDEEVAECYLSLINCLTLVQDGQAWLLYRPLRTGLEGQGAMSEKGKEKRRVVTLGDVRRAWQEELDRVADVAAGRFAIGGEGWEERDGADGYGNNGRTMPGEFGQGGEKMEVDVAS